VGYDKLWTAHSRCREVVTLTYKSCFLSGRMRHDTSIYTIHLQLLLRSRHLCQLRNFQMADDQNLTPPLRNASCVDPMQEITRLKHSVSLLETFILANHRNLPYKRPLDPPTLSSPSSPLKKEPQDSPESIDRDNAPGILGSQGHGGFYAGTTAVITHLTMVCFPRTPSFTCLPPPG
jgi:hypothetical protein